MKLKNIRTGIDLRTYLEAHVEDDVTNDTIEWFVAMSDAALIGDCFSRKDMASMFLDGIPAIKDNPKAIDDFIGTFFEDYDWCLKDGSFKKELKPILKEAVRSLRDTIAAHFGSTYTPYLDMS